MVGSTSSSSNMRGVINDNSNPYRNMVMDAMWMNQGYASECPIVDEEPNAEVARFFDFLKTLTKHYEMGAQITVNYRSLHMCSPLSQIMGWLRLIMTELLNEKKNILHEGNRLKENFYVAKSMIKPLGLGYQEIDICPNFCMLYYLENTELNKCRTCEHARYNPRIDWDKTLIAHRKLRYFTITPKLQRLFMSLKNVVHMTWHHLHDAVDGAMIHLFDREAWKYFNRVHCQFLMKLRNVHLRLYIDGFNAFGSFIAHYSCWTMILTVYNLPPGMYVSLGFMFLFMIIPNPNSPGWNIDVCLRPKYRWGQDKNVFIFDHTQF